MVVSNEAAESDLELLNERSRKDQSTDRMIKLEKGDTARRSRTAGA